MSIRNSHMSASGSSYCFRPVYGAANILSLADDRDKTRHYSRQLLKICAHAEVPGRAESQDARRAVQP